MGKHKRSDASAAKIDIGTLKCATKKGDTKYSGKPELRPEDKTVLPKDGGAKPAKKAQKSEIDDIFNTGKKKSLEGKREAAEAVGKEPDGIATAAIAKRPRIDGSKDDIFGEATGKGRKRTDEGYAIYTEEELGLGKKGGDTDLCPFDCDCCF
ncbi:hypothetical protein Vretimale_1830 [Volvox reticuliferus]|uniref:Uncharacterized protein n=1 Tax=Volvox reticuliferus TaxID=1737510 RepID=A0A8J4CXJ0_9CHLO|nr:hypothetical protein Vretifemale_17331 [Volvox reticuliferus]GIL95911.1 hypothetical protein Vretimale_1830 [Volvox reticuliferus]